MTTTHLAQRTSNLKPSLIRDIAEEGMTMDGVLPLWFGEGTWPSSDHIVTSAQNALNSGAHFYQPNSGNTALRDAVCAYTTSHYGVPCTRDRITVTASGMQGLALTAQALISPGDRVVTLQPAWPNIAEAFRISGAELDFVALEAKNGRWSLDMDRFLAALTSQTKAVLINSPHNPTGWAMPQSDLQVLLEHCRLHGIWIVSDDVYARLYRADTVAPSLVSIATPEDRVISINSFSKAWSMTGWRLGWINAPEELVPVFAMLTEFNIAGPAGFVQAAGVTALSDGERDIDDLKSKLASSYTVMAAALERIDGITFLQPDGAFYCFFRVDGMRDSLSTARYLLRHSKLGVAPGVAFGDAGEGCLRLCYAQPADRIEEAVDRLARGLPQAIQ